jgi:hypothetical protein
MRKIYLLLTFFYGLTIKIYNNEEYKNLSDYYNIKSYYSNSFIVTRHLLDNDSLEQGQILGN